MKGGFGNDAPFFVSPVTYLASICVAYLADICDILVPNLSDICDDSPLFYYKIVTYLPLFCHKHLPIFEFIG